MKLNMRCAAAGIIGAAAMAGCAGPPMPAAGMPARPITTAAAAPTVEAHRPLPALLDVAALVPDLQVDLRYFGRDNFVGTRIDGYEAPKCLLLPAVAEALARVERSLHQQSLRLVVFDCYRPQRAVAHFMRWARDLADVRTQAEYHPNLDKSALVPDYIAERSGHSRGDTVDVGLLACVDGVKPATCSPLDMGTRFDFFDPRAHTDSPAVDASQRGNRHRLRAAMAAEGFSNYAREWWHYSRRDAAAPAPLRDEPVR